MSMIVAGHFNTKTEAHAAMRALIALGIEADHVKSSFAFAPPDWDAADPFATYSGAFGRAVDSFAASDPDKTLLARAAGIVLAVDSPLAADRDRAAAALREHGGRNVVEAERTWKDGRWADPTPVAQPMNRAGTP